MIAKSEKLSIRNSGNVAVVDVTGRITLADGADALGEQFRELNASGHAKIILNLSGVTFMDTSGIGELVSCHVSAAPKGRVRLCGLTKRSRNLFQMLQLDGILDVYESEEEAIHSFV